MRPHPLHAGTIVGFLVTSVWSGVGVAADGAKALHGDRLFSAHRRVPTWPTAEVGMKHYDRRSGLRLDHTGVCEVEAVLSPVSTVSGRRQPPTIADYDRFVRRTSRRYRKACPKTAAIAYSLPVVPRGYRCPPEEVCLVMVARRSNWEPRTFGFEMEGVKDDPVRDLPAVARVLSEEDFELLERRRNLFAFFFESFIRIYSKHCRWYVDEPVARRVEVFEHRLSDFESTTLRKRFGPMDRIYVDRRYVRYFERLYGSYKVWAINKTMRDVAAGRDAGPIPRGSAQRSTGFFVSNYRKLERLIDNHCTDRVVQSAYVNMLRFAERTEPFL